MFGCRDEVGWDGTAWDQWRNRGRQQGRGTPKNNDLFIYHIKNNYTVQNSITSIKIIFSPIIFYNIMILIMNTKYIYKKLLIHTLVLSYYSAPLTKSPVSATVWDEPFLVEG